MQNPKCNSKRTSQREILKENIQLILNPNHALEAKCANALVGFNLDLKIQNSDL